MVSYLVPYNGKRVYSFTAPLSIARINFLLPDQVKVSLQGSGLMGPESMTLQNGESYAVYSYSDLNAGETVSLTIGGKVASGPSKSKTKTPLAVGTAFLGFVIMGIGIWWWRKPVIIRNDNNDVQSNEATLDELILEIAKLDEEHENGNLNTEEHQLLRRNLMARAKRLL